ncbi:winged helix-turn-helix domain-containing protein [Sphingomonas sp.]|uniref:winged helix-turn-helix domain-containing protein n=1 Tax=Sphingomonas sp. TaxID=28214 RepID=UPI003CC5579D
MSSCLRISIRLLHDGEIALGPGKADLLDAIAATGSISAAGRQLGLSYRRAWLLVDTMNRAFAAPLVTAAKGGARGGGAALTETGQAVLAGYRALQATVDRAAVPAAANLIARMTPRPIAEF